MTPSSPIKVTGISGEQNSAMTCRQAPQGEIGSGVCPDTTKCVNDLSPSEIALKNAVRSAQFVKPNDAFSMLIP